VKLGICQGTPVTEDVQKQRVLSITLQPVRGEVTGECRKFFISYNFIHTIKSRKLKCVQHGAYMMGK
jgi:hypothetical protein